MKNNSDKTAFVTGGAGGIGQAICSALARDGWRVAVADLPGTGAEEIAKAVEGLAVDLDVRDAASVQAAIGKTEEALGPVGVAVNCAGWDDFMPFVETDEDFMTKVLDINLAGPIRVMRRVLPGMMERGEGRIVNIASDAGRVGSSLESVYSAAKGGLIAITKTIAREAARSGVTSNAICPGPTDTPLLARLTEASERGEKIAKALKRAVPMGRLGLPADIAPAVVFLASEGASYITGQTLSVSGGLTMA